MEATVKAVEVLAPPSSAVDPEGPSDPKDTLSTRLEDIIGTYGSAKSFLQQQVDQVASIRFTQRK